MKAILQKSLATAFFLLAFAVFPTVSLADDYIRKNAVVMGTDFEAIFLPGDRELVEPAFEAALKELRRIEEMMSEWKEGSKLSLVNRYSGKAPVVVDEELFNVIEASLKVSALTGGAFDATWASMRGVWDFSAKVPRVPTDEEVRARLPLVDFRQVELDKAKKTVFLKKEGMSIGLGGIAKGYAIDRGAMAIHARGIKNFVLKAGGDMRVQGEDRGEGWEIGIADPLDADKVLAKVRLKDVSISTSGDYERFFMLDGVRYHHIIDPKTGFPARLSISATVIAPDTMTSDALSTALFVLGPQDGLALAKRLKGIEAVMIGPDLSVATSGNVELIYAGQPARD